MEEKDGNKPPIRPPGKSARDMGGQHWSKKMRIFLYFLEVRFVVAALAGFAGGAVVLVTRPDLVLRMTLGCSTIAGA